MFLFGGAIIFKLFIIKKINYIYLMNMKNYLLCI